MGDEWIKLIIPAIVLVIWTLGQIFNREPKPEPVRRPLPGPRPGGLPPAPRPPDRIQNAPPRDPTLRWPASAPAGQAQANRDSFRDDDIIVISAEPAPPAPTRGGGAARSSQRSRQGRAAAARQPEPSPSRPLAGGRTSPLSQPFDRPMGPLQQTLVQTRALPTFDSLPPVAQPDAIAISVADLRLAVRSRARLREAFLLNEILQPPLALRGRRRS